MTSEYSGSEMWAARLNRSLASNTTVRVGVAPKALPALMRQSEMLGPLPFMADLANGLLYLCCAGVQAIEPVRQSARQAGGYAIVLNPSSGTSNVWGYTPDSLDLMRALKARWDPRRLLNPGAFMV